MESDVLICFVSEIFDTVFHLFLQDQEQANLDVKQVLSGF